MHLREQATVRIDILGFTEVERNQFIQQALKDQPQSIKELSLVELRMLANPISGQCAQLTVEALQHNNTLQLLHLPEYSEEVKKRIKLSAEEVNRSDKGIMKLKVAWYVDYILSTMRRKEIVMYIADNYYSFTKLFIFK